MDESLMGDLDDCEIIIRELGGKDDIVRGLGNARYCRQELKVEVDWRQIDWCQEKENINPQSRQT